MELYCTEDDGYCCIGFDYTDHIGDPFIIGFGLFIAFVGSKKNAQYCQPYWVFRQRTAPHLKNTIGCICCFSYKSLSLKAYQTTKPCRSVCCDIRCGQSKLSSLLHDFLLKRCSCFIWNQMKEMASILSQLCCCLSSFKEIFQHVGKCSHFSQRGRWGDRCRSCIFTCKLSGLLHLLQRLETVNKIHPPATTMCHLHA